MNVLSEGCYRRFQSRSVGLNVANGTDIVATVNGVKCKMLKGNTLSINTATLDLSLTVDECDSDSSFSLQYQLVVVPCSNWAVTSSATNKLAWVSASVSTGQLGGASGRLYELGSGQGQVADLRT